MRERYREGDLRVLGSSLGSRGSWIFGDVGGFCYCGFYFGLMFLSFLCGVEILEFRILFIRLDREYISRG